MGMREMAERLVGMKCNETGDCGKCALEGELEAEIRANAEKAAWLIRDLLADLALTAEGTDTAPRGGEEER